MDTQRKSLRLGLIIILCATAVRLLAGSIPDFYSPEKLAALVLYLEAGRVPGVIPAPSAPPETSAQPQPTQPPSLLTPEDVTLVSLTNHTDIKPDLPQLLLEARFPALTGQAPTVLIIHTHGSECYLAQAGCIQISPYRSLDSSYNMISIGNAVADTLRQAGISVVHDTALHDQPDYNGAYTSSRTSIRQYLEKYPSIALVLDLHRDANSDYVNQLSTAATVGGTPSAQLMMVVGTRHDGWQQNMSLAVQLHAWLEKTNPGLCRPISFRTGSFNQDLLPGCLLVEVGAAGDSHAEALVAAEALAQAIIALSTQASP